jgi:hypothetical protein
VDIVTAKAQIYSSNFSWTFEFSREIGPINDISQDEIQTIWGVVISSTYQTLFRAKILK